MDLTNSPKHGAWQNARFGRLASQSPRVIDSSDIFSVLRVGEDVTQFISNGANVGAVKGRRRAPALAYWLLGCAGEKYDSRLLSRGGTDS